MFKSLLALSLLLCLSNCHILSFLGEAETVEQLANDHMVAWKSQNLSAILADYADDAVIIINNSVFQGHDQLRSVFAQLFELFSHGVMQIRPPTIQGQALYYTWRFTPDGFGGFSGSSTFILQNGKIQTHTVFSELYDMFPVK